MPKQPQKLTSGPLFPQLENYSKVSKTASRSAWASFTARKATAIMQQRFGVIVYGSRNYTAAWSWYLCRVTRRTDVRRNPDKESGQQARPPQNALQIATMDRQNADARTKAAISNAQALLSIDLKELDARQQSNALKYSAATQAALADAAADNARQQFNAKSELQVQEFFTELGVQIDTANINRDIAVKQFNINQENAYKEFNAFTMDQREKFNANMKFAIDQSNAQWRTD